MESGEELEAGSAYAMAKTLAKDYSLIEKVGFINKVPYLTFAADVKNKINRFVEKDNVAYADQVYLDLFF